MAKRATRAAFGQALIQLAKDGCDVMAVDADLTGSTKTAEFGKEYPDRLVNVGIAEQNMIGVAAGLSVDGHIAFTGSFAVFGTGRCYDQIRNIVCDANLNVKICPTHAGITVGEDGATHQALEDISLMRTLPNMKVLVPADYNSTIAAIKLAAKTPGPIYVRMGREPVEDIYDESIELDFPCSRVLRKGSDVSILACGVEVTQALAAADILSAEGIDAEVIDCISIKPLDEEVILASAKKCGRVVTCEEHMVMGGLGSAVAELLSEKLPTKMKFVGMRSFGTSAPAKDLMPFFGLDSAGIASTVKQF